MKKLVINGPAVHPGANFVDTQKDGRKFLIKTRGGLAVRSNSTIAPLKLFDTPRNNRLSYDTHGAQGGDYDVEKEKRRSEKAEGRSKDVAEWHLWKIKEIIQKQQEPGTRSVETQTGEEPYLN